MRANVIVADIAIILGAYSNMENNDNENYEVIGRENEEKKEEENKTNDDDMIEDQMIIREKVFDIIKGVLKSMVQ